MWPGFNSSLVNAEPANCFANLTPYRARIHSNNRKIERHVAQFRGWGVLHPNHSIDSKFHRGGWSDYNAEALFHLPFGELNKLIMIVSIDIPRGSLAADTQMLRGSFATIGQFVDSYDAQCVCVMCIFWISCRGAVPDNYSLNGKILYGNPWSLIQKSGFFSGICGSLGLGSSRSGSFSRLNRGISSSSGFSESLKQKPQRDTPNYQLRKGNPEHKFSPIGHVLLGIKIAGSAVGFFGGILAAVYGFYRLSDAPNIFRK